MKKPAAKPKKPASKTASRKKRAGPLGGLISDADLDLVRRLFLEAMPDDDRSAEAMIESFLSADPTDADEAPDAETMSELAEELDRLRVDATGGDPDARAELGAVRERIDKAARRNEIHPGILLMLGRLFAGAHVDIGDAARASMGRMVAAGVFHEPDGEAYGSLVQPLLADLAGDDFDLHEEVRSLSAIFPSDYRARLVQSFAADRTERARRSAVGFLLDDDDQTALSAIRGLAAQGKIDPSTRRRIELMRPWLSPVRREALDAAFPPSAAAEAPDAAKAIVRMSASACDGSGTMSVMATVKSGSRYAVVPLMLKASGVADSFVVGDLTKAGAAAMERDARAAVPSAEAPLQTFVRLVALALGRGVAAGLSPPFELVRALETIGISSLVPDPATPSALIDELLARTPDRDDPDAIAKAGASAAELELAEGWFEAGEAVEDILESTATIEEGAQALLESWLPKRRAFWASQCALTALALEAGPEAEIARDLALVGREILRESPLVGIPLMREIARGSAIAFFARRGEP